MAGAPVHAPVRMSNVAPCKGHMMRWPRNLPSLNLASACEHRFSTAKYSSRKRQMTKSVPLTSKAEKLFSSIKGNQRGQINLI